MMAKISPDEPCPCGALAPFGECHGPKVRTREPPRVTERIPLRVIAEPDPGSRAVFEKSGAGSLFFQGFDTGLAWVCGQCTAALAAGIQPGQIRGVILRCNQCGSFNEV